MAFHLAHIHDYERFLAIDIGSYRVRTGVYSINGGEVSCVWFGWARQNKRNIIHWSIADLRWVSLSIERSMVQACQKVDTIPTDAIVSFSSSTFISDILMTQYVRTDKTKEITMQEIDTMIKKVEKESFQRVKIRAKDQFGITHDDIRLVSSTITSISIDGKSVNNPVWFSGSNVRLSVLNIFSPASEFNIIRYLASNLGKRIISIIPTPLVFPKILEKSEYASGLSYVVDIGYLHTNFLVIRNNEIELLETFPFGANMLMEMLGKSHPELSILQIENLLSDKKNKSLVQWDIQEFLEYLFDVFSHTLDSLKNKTFATQIFCHGGLFENSWFLDTFESLFRERISEKVRIIPFREVIDRPAEEVVPYGLSLLADELLVVKKDPLVRILRYVLYSYE